MSIQFDLFDEFVEYKPMNIATLKSLAKIKGLKQSDVAAMANVSRQAVHRWWKNGHEVNINVLSQTQEQLAQGFGVPMDVLSLGLPILNDESKRQKWETQLLWDRLYPNLEAFVRGLILGHPEALARLVQVCGLFAAQKIIGKSAIRTFPTYKNKIHPGRRRSLEIVWNEIQNQI